MLNNYRNIVICGYFGFNNAGDELILKTLSELLKTKFNNFNEKNITVLSNNPEQTSREYKVNSIKRWNLFVIIFTILNTDIVIFTAGLFQDITSIISLYYYLGLIILSKLLNKKVILLGVDFGPIKYKFDKLVLKSILKFVDRIYVRTEGSYNFLKTNRFLNNTNLKYNIRLGSDILFSKNIEYKPELKTELANIYLILRRPDKKNYISNYFNIIELCEQLIKESNIKLVFVPFHIEEDMYFILEIVEKLPNSVTIMRWNKADNLFNIISNADLLISQRLHGLIIGTLLFKPILGISYDPKLKYFMDEIGLGNYVLPSFSSNKIVFDMIKEIWAEREHIIYKIKQNLPKLQSRFNLEL